MTEWESGMSTGTSAGPVWVSAADAADKAGTSPTRVREWAREGVIASQSSNGPLGEQVLVRLDEVVERARRDQGDRLSHADQPPQYAYTPASELSPILKTIPELVAQLTAATDRAARAETKVEFLSRQVNDLRRQLTSTPGPDGAGEMALEQGQVTEPEAEAEAEPEAESPPESSSLFEDDVEAPEEGVSGEPSELLGDTSLEGIWEDDAPERTLERGSSSSRSESSRPRDISARPRRRWWQWRRR